jgi:RNA polymerase sigma factor (sigma-70 family)
MDAIRKLSASDVYGSRSPELSRVPVSPPALAAPRDSPSADRIDLFATTRWSVVLAADRRNSAQSRAALEYLCRTYWFPLYAYIRRRGYEAPDAEDLTQGFFARLLERNFVEGLDPAKGRFRAFLLAALKHFLSDRRDYDRATKRGGGERPLSFHTSDAEESYQHLRVDFRSPDVIFERQWALQVIERAGAKLEGEVKGTPRELLYRALQSGGLTGSDEITYAEIGAQLGLSETAVKSAALRFRRRYAELIREEITDTLVNVADIDGEIRHLIQVLSW